MKTSSHLFKVIVDDGSGTKARHAERAHFHFSTPVREELHRVQADNSGGRARRYGTSPMACGNTVIVPPMPSSLSRYTGLRASLEVVSSQASIPFKGMGL